jgi:hypothetical protein
LKFEHVLQTYWTRHYLYNGSLRLSFFSPQQVLYSFAGLHKQTQRKLILLLESNYYFFLLSNSFYFNQSYFNDLTLRVRFRINQFCGRIGSLNYTLNELLSLHVVHRLLLQTYRGRCFFFKRPVRGQTTRTNCHNAKNMCGRNLSIVKLVRNQRKRKMRRRLIRGLGHSFLLIQNFFI